MSCPQKLSVKKPASPRKLPTQGGGFVPALENATWPEILEESYRILGQAKSSNVVSKPASGNSAATPDV
jgi:hypothetical protein